MSYALPLQEATIKQQCKMLRMPMVSAQFATLAEQAVRERHVIEIERICRGDPGNDPDLLNPQQNQDCPDDVDELHGDEQDPQGNDWLPGLACEAGSVMTDEHRICFTCWEFRLGMQSLNAALGPKFPPQRRPVTRPFLSSYRR